MAKLFANSGGPDQTPRSAASDLGLHCLPITFLRVSRLYWVKGSRSHSKNHIYFHINNIVNALYALCVSFVGFLWQNGFI